MSIGGKWNISEASLQHAILASLNDSVITLKTTQEEFVTLSYVTLKLMTLIKRESYK